MFVIISVIYRPIEQLLSRTIAERRARGQTDTRCASRSRSRLSFALIFLVSRWPFTSELVNHVFDGYARCMTCWSSARSPTQRATSRAAGWPGTSTSACSAASC